MKKVGVIVLSVVLLVVAGSGVVLFHKNREARNALLMSEQNAESWHEKMVRLEHETVRLKNQIRANEAQIETLASEIQSKNQTISNFQQKFEHVAREPGFREDAHEHLRSLHATTDAGLEAQLQNQASKTTGLQKQLQEADARAVSLHAELLAEQGMVGSLEKQLDNARALALLLEAKIEQGQTGKQELKELLSELQQKQDQLKTRTDQLQSEYTAMVSQLENELKNKTVTIEKLKERLSITFIDSILFDSAKSSISPEGRTVLETVGTILRDVQNHKILVIGHTDNLPIKHEYQHIFPSNWELSTARATAVVRYFQFGVGLDPANLEAAGRAHHDPVASNETSQGRAKNRRVNILITPNPE